MDMRASVITRIALVACLLLTACGGSRQPSAVNRQTPPLEPQKGQVWQLVAVRGKAVNRQAEPVTLTFNPEAKTVSGRTACNNYYGNYTLRLEAQQPEGDRYTLTLSGIGYGDTRCPEAEMNAEARYMALFEKADALMLDAYTMTLYQKGRETLKYELQ